VIKLAAFLGNPGSKYAGNRHNVGRLLAKALPFSQNLSWQKKFNGLFVTHDGINFVMPEGYMNRSGVSVQAVANFFKIEVEEIIVVHDELELPLGTISLKFAGGLGGHNGLRSMKESFGSADFWRLRIGLGRPDSRQPGEGGPPGSGEGIVDWVLSDFLKEEYEILTPTLTAAVDLLTQTFTVDPSSLLDVWRKKKISITNPDITENENIC